MTILLEILLKEYNMKVYFVKCLKQTLFVIIYLCEHILVKTDHSLFVVNWS